MRKTLGVSLFGALVLIGLTFFPVTVHAGVSASPPSLNFGSVTVNTASAPITLTITNTSRQNVSIGGLDSSLPVFAITGPAFPLTLRAHSSASFQVRFAPVAAVAYTGKITIALEHMFGLTETVPVSGTGAAAPAAPTYLLSASATSLSFGNILVGSSAAQLVTLTNTGTGNVSISQAAVSGAGFSVSGFSGAATLAPGQSLSLSVNFAPAAAGSAAGSLSVASNASNSPATIALSAAGVQPQISLSPASIAFPSLIVGQSNSKSLTLTNSGTANVSISQATISGTGFSLAGLSLPLTLAPGASSSFSISFAPAAAGAVSGGLSLTSNAPTSPLAVALSGTGVAQTLQVSASPASLSFGNLAVGSTASQSVTLSNTGNSNVSVSQLSVSGSGFTTSGLTLPLTLAAGQTASFSVTFSPTSAGSLSATATVTSNATNSPASIALSGTGIQPAISVIPSSVAFGSLAVGVTNSQTLAIQNPGAANLTISQANLSGSGLSFTGLTLPLMLAPNASTTATLSFTPISAGAVSGSLSLVNNSPSSPLAVPITGTGVAQSLQLSASPASLSFGSVTDGTSASQTVTLSNTGNANVSLSQISVSGTAFTASGLAVPLTLSPGQTAQFSVTFAPTTTGALSGTATVTSNASNSPASVSLSGTGAAAPSHSVSLNWTPSGSSYNGFNIYRGSVSGGPYTRVNSSVLSTTSYTDSSVTSGSMYYYVATEVGTDGVESSYSNVATAAIP